MAAKKRKGTPKAKKENRKRSRAASGTTADSRVFKALAHPLRFEMLTILNDRAASPNELHKELEEGLSQVSYHIKVLRDFKMIEQVKTAPRRGAVEHFYRATEKVFVTADELKLIPRSAQRGLWGPILVEIEEDTSTSLSAGTFGRRNDFVVAREVLTLDDKARKEAEVLATEFYAAFTQLGVDSDRRRQNGQGDGEEIQTTAAMLIFDSALGKNLKRRK